MSGYDINLTGSDLTGFNALPSKITVKSDPAGGSVQLSSADSTVLIINFKGIEFDYAVEGLRKNLLFKHKVFTGNASNKNTIRLLPTLNIQPSSLEYFLEALKKEMQVLA